MKLFLKVLFGAIFVWMTTMTIRTLLQISIADAWDSYAANPWAVATLWDAYCGFVTFYVWVLFKERTAWSRILWFVLIMGLGNITMSLYVLIQLFRLPDDQPVESLLWVKA
jgi:hypothetical protein